MDWEDSSNGDITPEDYIKERDVETQGITHF